MPKISHEAVACLQKKNNTQQSSSGAFDECSFAVVARAVKTKKKTVTLIKILLQDRLQVTLKHQLQ